MAKPKSKASSSTQSSNARVLSADGASNSYFTKKVYTAQQRDQAVREAQESASNTQKQLERDAQRLDNLKREITELETQLHISKMRYKDLQESYTDTLAALTRHLDSLR